MDPPRLSVFGLHLPVPRRRADAIRTALSVWSWSTIATAVIGGFGVQLPLALATWGDKTRCVPGRFLRDLAVVVSKLNPMWDFEVHGELPDYIPAKTVAVSNHVSNSDPFLISHLPWEMKWLGKSSLFKVPFIGWLMFFAGDVAVERGAKGSVLEAMDTCKEHLERGMPVMIFPEGTRSASGELLPFKNGAFRLAIETGADILPIAIAGTRTALPKHSWRFGFSRALVTVGTPLPTQGMTLDDIDDLKVATRNQIEAMYGTLRTLV